MFLVETSTGGMKKLDILTPSKAKDTAVEQYGKSTDRAVLTPRNEARDVTLHFALYNKTQAGC